ncbi:hypothetical protein CBOM_03844 [Ceraceosorus bombacis]|uniref:Uncharacterized protein n=1 Tax=Ceraceosorus bombacis TaxID=401625 RepID=A0A0P1BH76_9BASI|nr:hypothetical protein CBOM_03844 [Ceraceosorus bombacis]
MGVGAGLRHLDGYATWHRRLRQLAAETELPFCKPLQSLAAALLQLLGCAGLSLELVASLEVLREAVAK